MKLEPNLIATPPNPGPAQRRGTAGVIQIGRLRLTGPVAVVFRVAILGLLVWLIIYMRPRLGMLLTGGLWMAFQIYWAIAARNSAPATSSESRRSRGIHVLILNISFLLLFIPLPGLTRHFLPEWPFLVPIGLALQAAFFLLAFWSRRHLGRNWSGEVSIKAEHQLVRTGPYRFIRHPIYTAMFGMYIGTAIVSARYNTLVAIAMMAIAYGRKIPMEEKALGEAFAADYASYRRKSWALFPPLY